MRFEPKAGLVYRVEFKDGGMVTLRARNARQAATIARYSMINLPVPDGEEPCIEPPSVERVVGPID